MVISSKLEEMETRNQMNKLGEHEGKWEGKLHFMFSMARTKGKGVVSTRLHIWYFLLNLVYSLLELPKHKPLLKPMAPTSPP